MKYKSKSDAVLLLEDGTVFFGKSAGKFLIVTGKSDTKSLVVNWFSIKSLNKADGLVVGSAICKEITNSIQKRQNPVTNVANLVKKLKNKIL